MLSGATAERHEADPPTTYVPQYMFLPTTYVPKCIFKQVQANLSYQKVLTEAVYLPRVWIRSQVLLTL